jgi:hypothetical protein
MTGPPRASAAAVRLGETVRLPGERRGRVDLGRGRTGGSGPERHRIIMFANMVRSGWAVVLGGNAAEPTVGPTARRTAARPSG